MRRLCLPLFLGFLGTAACAPHVQFTPMVQAHTDVALREVQEAEQQTFHELAASDARFAKRAHLEPTQAELGLAMQTSLVAEENAALISGAPDPFTRAPRARALARAKERLAKLTAPDANAKEERALLAAVVHEEELRFVHEATLPLAGVRLVRALATLEPPRSNPERSANDTTLARRLGEIEDSLDDADTLDGDAITDALDELEPQVAALYPETEKALTSLRLAGSRDLPEPRAGRALPPTSVQVTPSTKEAWISARKSMRQELVSWQSAADSVNESERQRRATELLFGRGACSAPKLPAGLGLSPERSFACHALLQASDSPLLLQLVIHDLLTLGLWSLELSADRRNYRRVLSSYAMAGRVAPDEGARLARRVAAEPELGIRAAQIGAALASQPANARATWIQAYVARGLFLPEEL